MKKTYTTAEVRKKLGLSVRKLQYLRQLNPQIKVKRPGRDLVFTAENVRQLAKARKQIKVTGRWPAKRWKNVSGKLRLSKAARCRQTKAQWLRAPACAK